MARTPTPDEMLSSLDVNLVPTRLCPANTAFLLSQEQSQALFHEILLEIGFRQEDLGDPPTEPFDLTKVVVITNIGT